MPVYYISMKKSYDCYIFDFDGTIHNSVPLVEKATNAALVAAGFKAESRESIVEGMRLDTVGRMLLHAGQADNLQLGERMADDFYRRFAGLLDATIIFDGVADVIRTLAKQGKALAIVSNNRSSLIEDILIQHKLRDLFFMILGEDNAREKKPLPGGIFDVCTAAEASVEQSLFIGDSLTDSQSAQAAGIHSIGVLWNHEAGEDISGYGFDSLISNPAELINFG